MKELVYMHLTPRRTLNSLFFKVFLVTLSFAAMRCGIIGIGSGSSPNDPVPSGTIIAQGTFSGTNGQTVIGSAFVYRTGSLSFIVRVENLTAPNENNLQVVVRADGQEVFTSSLRSNTGNQNYTTAVGSASTWNSVTIRSSIVAAPNNDYGIALLDNLQSN